MFGPGKARYDDHILAVCEAAGLTGTLADQAAATVFTFVLGNALGPAAAASLSRKLSGDANAEQLMRDSMAEAREIASQFPRLRARLETPAAAYAAAPDDTFAFCLQALLDGLDAQLAPHEHRAWRVGE
ncbi:TetR/AcrR family transcriptional regulator C-terminal domain-containing protein (plasmid) [Streptomyces sp. NBC_00015]